MAIQEFRGGTAARRRIVACLGLVTVAALFWLAACTSSRPLVVAVHPWVGYETLFLARDFRWLPDTTVLHVHNALSDSLAELQSGEADAACMTLDEMLRARATGLPLSAVLVLDISAGADTVLARPNIRSLRDLAHKRIGFDPDALGALVFEKLLEAAGLPASAVVQVNLPPARQLDAWRRNEVDVIITYEPMSTTFVRKGARKLFDSRQMPDTIIDVIAVRRDRPETLPALRALILAHFRARDYLRANEQDALFRIAGREEVQPDDVRRMLAGVNLPSLAANRVYLGGDRPRLREAAKTLSALMVRRGLLAREDDLDKLILPDTLPGEGR